MQINIGMDTVGGMAQVTVFMNLDASATLDLTVIVGGSVTVVDTTDNATAAAAPAGISASNSPNATAVNTTNNTTTAAAPINI